ncbi:hypothetical protein [Aureimonas leprariae]|uniref:Uncharacterized protein n=1 Tax=Plantimonas leprariae TaxID=2615207 RepID=A0A7V7PQ02_9HYPH|nr:hypothetical protein [Aureimonas leprariae]KAB0680161.1 hypothetical protein F6X38_08195 [Aureimonas leprariae]
MSGLPFGNFFTSSDYQQADQAGREFLASVLRKDSGAAITDQEMAIYGKTYLPQPGDGAEVLQQKRAARRQALSAIETGLGPARTMLPGRGGASQPGPADAPQAQTGTVPSNLKGKYGLR